MLTTQGSIPREGTILDKFLIAAPPSTKNAERKRDPEMSSREKDNPCHLGMTAHSGRDRA